MPSFPNMKVYPFDTPGKVAAEVHDLEGDNNIYIYCAIIYPSKTVIFCSNRI